MTPARSRVSAGTCATGATTCGSGTAVTGAGGGSTGRSTGSGLTGGGVLLGSGSGRRTAGRGRGTGLRRALLPFISAGGGGAGCRRPPPPPPPPGPGVARNTSRMWVGSRRVSSGALATRMVVNSTSPANRAACRAPEAARARAGDRLAPMGARNSPRSASGAPRSSRTARTASAAATNRPSIVSSCPDAISPVTSRRLTPAARAISRVVNTSGTDRVTEDMEVLCRTGKILAAAPVRGRTAPPRFSAVIAPICYRRAGPACARTGTGAPKR
jgi:hypothetical protein